MTFINYGSLVPLSRIDQEGELQKLPLLANSRKWFVGTVIDESHIAAGRSVPDEMNIVLDEAVTEVG